MKIENIQLVLSAGVDASLPLYAGPTVDKISKRRRGNLVRPNLPDGAPPELPRLAVQFKDAHLQIGNNRIELIARPPNHVAHAYDPATEFSVSLAAGMFRELLDNVGEQLQFSWSAVVSTFNFPRFSGAEAAQAKPMSAIRETANQLLSVELRNPNVALAGFGLNLAYSRSGYFINYGVSEYEVKQAKVTASPGVAVSINVDQVPTTEMGIGLVIDVNSRPLPQERRQSPLDDLYGTLKQHKKAFESYSEDLGLAGVL